MITPKQVGKTFEQDFSDTLSDKALPQDQDDLKFMKITSEGIHQTEDGHYEMPLPLRNRSSSLPDNRKKAESRIEQLRRHLERNPQYKKDYTEFMNDGHAQRVQDAMVFTQFHSWQSKWTINTPRETCAETVVTTER